MNGNGPGWVTLWLDDPNHVGRFLAVATYHTAPGTRAIRVQRVANLTEQEKETWSPAAAWQKALTADNKKARSLR